MDSKVVALYSLLHQCAQQNLIPFKKFDELGIEKCYLIDRFVVLHSPFGVKLGVIIACEDEGSFILNLPDRFKPMANQNKVDELNSVENKGYLYYGGKERQHKNRIILAFPEKQDYRPQKDDSTNNSTIESKDVPQ